MRPIPIGVPSPIPTSGNAWQHALFQWSVTVPILVLGAIGPILIAAVGSGTLLTAATGWALLWASVSAVLIAACCAAVHYLLAQKNPAVTAFLHLGEALLQSEAGQVSDPAVRAFLVALGTRLQHTFADTDPLTPPPGDPSAGGASGGQ